MVLGRFGGITVKKLIKGFESLVTKEGIVIYSTKFW